MSSNCITIIIHITVLLINLIDYNMKTAASYAQLWSILHHNKFICNHKSQLYVETINYCSVILVIIYLVCFADELKKFSKVNKNIYKPKVADKVKEYVRQNFTREMEFYNFCKQRLYRQYAALHLPIGELDSLDSWSNHCLCNINGFLKPNYKTKSKFSTTLCAMWWRTFPLLPNHFYFV